MSVLIRTFRTKFMEPSVFSSAGLKRKCLDHLLCSLLLSPYFASKLVFNCLYVIYYHSSGDSIISIAFKVVLPEFCLNFHNN
jgi:hypothetical protein